MRDSVNPPTSVGKTVGIATLVYVAFYVISTFILPRLVGINPTATTTLPQSLDLTQMIRQVKHEVGEATRIMIEGGEPAMFQADRLELEIQFVVGKKAGSETPELVPIGINSEVSSEKVQRIRLIMEALPQPDYPATEGEVTDDATIVIPN